MRDELAREQRNYNNSERLDAHDYLRSATCRDTSAHIRYVTYPAPSINARVGDAK
jgi:hypothetical protein